MQHPSLNKLCGILASAAIVLALAGCNGGGSSSGPAGPPGTPAPTNTVNVANLTTAEWAALSPQGTVTKVTMGTAPVVDFAIKDPAGNGLAGLGFSTLSVLADRSGNYAVLPGLSNLTFSLAKLIPENGVTGAPSKWVNYIVTTVPTKKADGSAVAVAPQRPSSDNTGTLVDHGDGTYTYTFYRDITATQTFLNNYSYTAPSDKADLGDVTYEPTRIHRLTIQLSGNARNTGSNTPNGVTTATAVAMSNPINIIYDFVPSTGQPVLASDTRGREIASTAKCAECHDTSFKTTPHAGRVDVRYCVVCHTDQRKYGYAEATVAGTLYSGSTNKINGGAAGDMTAMAHRIHMGTLLSRTGYNYANIKFEKLGYSILEGGQRMCSKCHSGSINPAPAAQGENWNLKPSRLACGTCHDSVDFTAGTIDGVANTHLVQTSDVACAGCHDSDYIKTKHRTNNLTPHNPTITPGLANFTYEIKEVTQAVSGGPVTIKFRFLSDGGVAGAARTPVTNLNITPVAGGVSAPLAGFTSAPSFLLSWAMTQDGVTSPVDYNNLLTADGAPSSSNFQPRTVSITNLTNTSVTIGSLAGPDNTTDGYYTATVTNTANIFPAGAKMRTVAIQGSFTQISPAAARPAIAVTKTATGDTPRRTAIDNTKCASCHEWFIGHGGSRVYDVQTCVMCHVPGITTSGRGMTDAALSTYWAAGLFTADQKAILKTWTTNATYPTGIDFTVNPVATSGLTNVALNFPQVTNNMKDMIHGIHAGKDRTTNSFKIVRNRTPNAVNIINSAEIGFPGILANCQSCHTYNGYSGVPANTLASRDEAINTAGNTTTAFANSALALLNSTDRMTTPFTASCNSCHDSAAAAAHMMLNGGQISVPRSTLITTGESCAVCHGAGSTYDPVVVHM